MFNRFFENIAAVLLAIECLALLCLSVAWRFEEGNI
ncbi:hypothetical protein T4C_6186 [Trichinella pseudospiralis]|uniref:Uncharacterized protein n=1 Tax=Trichinella pseudospiralis TaxID=6337 RepID=A0A0V1GDN9_TRIPS|nr:hypothetical protein T4C_6186 [Trichinella pseudospiralis]